MRPGGKKNQTSLSQATLALGSQTKLCFISDQWLLTGWSLVRIRPGEPLSIDITALLGFHC
jgi:hypothetical protein